MTSIRRAFGLVTLTLALLATACSGGSADGEGGEAQPFGSGERFSIEAALAQIPSEFVGPEGSTNLEIHVADLLAAGDLAATIRPTGSTDVEEIADWLRPMTFGGETGVFLPLPNDLVRDIARIEEYRDELGFAISDVDASIQVTTGLSLEVTPGGGPTLVLVGDLESKAKVEVAPGVSSFGEGDDFEMDPAGRSAARPLGRPLRIAGIDDLVLLSSSTPVASAWIDPGSPRLDTDAALADVAAALDAGDIVGAVVIRADFSVSASPSDDGLGPPIATPFDTVGIGWGVVDGDAEITVVYATSSAADATAARSEVETAFLSASPASFGTPVAEQLVVRSVTTEGRLVVATLGLRDQDTSPELMLQLVYRRDAPFVYVS